MAKFNEYTQKTTPEDADTLMIYDDVAKANKLSPFSGIWNWIVGKLTNAVISNLQTNDKTVLGAINELNSKALPGKLKTLSNGESYSFNISHNSFLIYSPTDDLGTICVLGANGYSLIVGRIESVDIKSKDYSVTITNNMDWPVTFVVI